MSGFTGVTLRDTALRSDRCFGSCAGEDEDDLLHSHSGRGLRARAYASACGRCASAACGRRRDRPCRTSSRRRRARRPRGTRGRCGRSRSRPRLAACTAPRARARLLRARARRPVRRGTRAPSRAPRRRASSIPATGQTAGDDLLEVSGSRGRPARAPCASPRPSRRGGLSPSPAISGCVVGAEERRRHRVVALVAGRRVDCELVAAPRRDRRRARTPTPRARRARRRSPPRSRRVRSGGSSSGSSASFVRSKT